MHSHYRDQGLRFLGNWQSLLPSQSVAGRLISEYKLAMVASFSLLPVSYREQLTPAHAVHNKHHPELFGSVEVVDAADGAPPPVACVCHFGSTVHSPSSNHPQSAF